MNHSDIQALDHIDQDEESLLILVELKRQWLMAKAHEEGFRRSYQKHAVWRAQEAASNAGMGGGGAIISYAFSDGEVQAAFDGVEWCGYGLDRYQGPAIYGFEILKSGKKSKIRRAFCPYDDSRRKFVKVLKAGGAS
jgi:hypothetical protein